MSAVSRRVLMPFVVTFLVACGGDSGATGPTPSPIPQPPQGSATQVPRVLGLSVVNGKSVPAIYYQSADSQYNVKSDSGSATLQADSLLVVRTYDEWIPRRPGVNTGTLESFTGAGRLQPSGIAVFNYTDGTADTAHVLPDGGVVVTLTINERTSHPFGTFTFTNPYTGPALNPVPYVTSLWPASAMFRADSAYLVLTGSSFMPTTRLLWDKLSELKVTYVSPSQLTTVIPGEYLQALMQHTLTIINPAPGGGARIIGYAVTLGLPTITSIAPATMPAEGGDFTLHVHGSGFATGATVLWNGTARPATIVNPTDLTLAVSGADIKTAGTIQIAVQTPPPYGGTSSTATLAVTFPPAQKLAESSLPFSAGALAVDPVRPLVYAVADGRESTHANSVVAIDPTSASIVWSLNIGKSAGAMAVSDDGQYLYVAPTGDSTVVRVKLATHTIDTTFVVGHSSPDNLPHPYTVAVAPGQPTTFAVVLMCSVCITPMGFGKLVVLDNGVPRTHVVQGYYAPDTFAFADAGTIYGGNTSGNVVDIAVDAGGATVRNAPFTAPTITQTYSVAGSVVYGSFGFVYDMAGHTSTKVSGMPVGALVAMSGDRTLLYSASAPGQYVRAYDVVHDRLLGAVAVQSGWTAGSASAIVRWGADGLAFATTGVVHFVRADFVR